MKYWIKNLIAHALYYSGLLHLYRQLKLRNRAVVLMYHRVLTDEERRDSFSNDAIIVSPRTFERQIRFLKRHCRVLAPREFVRYLRERRPFPTGACLITFDDGWRDNYTNALPILRRHQAPAIVFLPTDYIGTGRLFWQERLGRMLLWLCQNRPAHSEALLQRCGLQPAEHEDPAALRSRIKAAVNRLKQRPLAEIEAFLGEVAAQVPRELPSGSDSYLDWSEVYAMGRDGIEFGSHAVRHWPLPRLDQQALTTELTHSKQELEQAFAAPVTTIAYPNGDYDETVTARTRDSGYLVGFTTRRGAVSADDDPLTVRRVNVHEDVTRSMPLFYCRVLGLL